MPVVAVVPFGATAEAEDRPRAGAWARQIARRLVDRFAGEATLEVRPVFLVALPQSGEEAGYLVFGSTPDAALAAQYARSLGGTHALTGTYREGAGSRRLEAALVDVDLGTASARLEHEVRPGELHLAEPALAGWLASVTGVAVGRDLAAPATANEPAYAALLEAMDAEVDATLLRDGDPAASGAALARAAAAYARAAAADPGSVTVEERVLVMAATAIETERQALALPALEALAEHRSRSWRAHYVLGETRRTLGDAAGAVVAFEHADALQPLRDADVVTLARLYVAAGARSVAAARLRRVIEGGRDRTAVATARRLRLGLVHPEAEADLERAGRAAIAGRRKELPEAEERVRRVLALDPELWEAHFALGLLAGRRGDAAAAERAFREALRIHPDQPEALQQLALLARKRRRN